MNHFSSFSKNSDQSLSSESPQGIFVRENLMLLLKKVRGTALLVIGFLLSPLSWWNDLFFNLPLAYGFGYICSLFFPNLFLPSAIAGYWISNILGILLMQLGAFDVIQNDNQKPNLKKELLTGAVSSTIYTCVILGLVHFGILQTPDLFASENAINFSSFFSNLFSTLVF